MTELAPSVEFECGCEASRGSRMRAGGRSAGEIPRESACPACGRAHALHGELLTGSGGLLGCAHCGHPELYREKDFAKSIGLYVVVAAALLAPFTYYTSLAAAALIDASLYAFWPERVVCYACGARHRGFAAQPRHPRFDREIAERMRFGARAIMGKPMRPGGTADAPEPEH